MAQRVSYKNFDLLCLSESHIESLSFSGQNTKAILCIRTHTSPSTTFSTKKGPQVSFLQLSVTEFSVYDLSEGVVFRPTGGLLDTTGEEGSPKTTV